MEVNRVPLTPLSLLRRTAAVFPTRTAAVYGQRRISYSLFYQRVCRLARGLSDLDIGLADKVAVLAPNVPDLLEAHFGIPWCGGIIVAINTRLNASEVGFILSHCEARVLIVHPDLVGALEPIAAQLAALRKVLILEDLPLDSQNSWLPEAAQPYEDFLALAEADEPPLKVDDEDQVIAINYTSGTTGNPKGVMFTHRGAALNALSDCLQHQLQKESVCLWTLPMFHCNGWCFTWALPAIGATSVCMRQVEPETVRDLIIAEGVTHFFGAPIILQLLAGLAEEKSFRFNTTVKAGTGGAPPSPTLLESMRALNVAVTHLYGLTETYGPNTLCEVQDDWLALPPAEQAALTARQGVPHPLAGEMAVLDDEGRPVPADGKTLGEVCMRGNTVMKGYYNNPEATRQAFRNGWFYSGDLAVLHADGYVELQDRSKDIIISGGENISSIEVENTLAAHPAVAEAAVVSQPDVKWGESPVAFVTIKPGAVVSEAEILAFCREKLAHFKCPAKVFFESLPRTSTGKVQKFALRERLWQGHQKQIRG